MGAGPAGLACAHKLAVLGHEATIYEARPKPGGLNEYGIAAYKTLNDFAQREVGYILGIRIATVMVAGSALSALVIVPAIFLWGRDLTLPFYPETQELIRDMSSGALRDRYVRYIGAGAVATAGILTLIKSIPTMVESFKVGFAQLRKGGDGHDSGERTARGRQRRPRLPAIELRVVFVDAVDGIPVAGVATNDVELAAEFNRRCVV